MQSRSDTADLWLAARDGAAPAGLVREARATALERELAIIATLDDAPPRTRHAASIVKSSPLSSSVRAMLETRAIGAPFDAVTLNLDAIAHRLPGLSCPAEVEFLASDRSLDVLELSISGLLQHRRRLVAPSIDRNKPRRNVFVLGAGPGGLMAAIELALRDHAVVVCEQREVYTRNRFIGVYKEIAHLMAALGMPESMTYDFTHYRGKRGIMLADIQTFLHAVALKLGVVIYAGAVARDLTRESVRAGRAEIHRSTRGAGAAESIGVTRWHHDTITRVRSGVSIHFDTIIEATGGRSGLREILVGPENVVSLRTLARSAAARDPKLDSFFDDPEDHCAEFVESDYGCPPGLRADYAAALLHGGDDAVPDELPCFVSNIDAEVLSTPIRPSDKVAGVGARIGDRELAIPPDWVVVECPLPDRRLTRYQIEGPLPRTFEFGGERVATSERLRTINPVSFLVRILYAMGVPFDAVDRGRLVDFYSVENSQGDASDVVATWIGKFSGLRLGATDAPIWCGAAGDAVEYAIIGEALQNAWYRFGVGVDDTFHAASRFAEGIDLDAPARLAEARRLERVMTARSVQVLYHLYAVARHVDQGVVGPVLAEYHLDERRSRDRAEAGLREESQLGAELFAAERDLQSGARDALLGAAIGYQRDQCARRSLALLEALAYDRRIIEGAMLSFRAGASEWRARAWERLGPALSPGHRALLAPLFADSVGAAGSNAGDERLLEIAMGRYAWATPWLRACALRALPDGVPGAEAARANAALQPIISPSTIDKVLLLEKVSLFRATPHEILAAVVPLLRDRWAAPGEHIFDKGDLGDCLYIVASGRVRVHDGDATFRHMGEHEFFGELSLLDAEPRSASVTAVEATHLFRLAQAEFHALTSERPEIVHAINRALCAMIRRAPPPA